MHHGCSRILCWQDVMNAMWAGPKGAACSHVCSVVRLLYIWNTRPKIKLARTARWPGTGPWHELPCSTQTTRPWSWSWKQWSQHSRAKRLSGPQTDCKQIPNKCLAEVPKTSLQRSAGVKPSVQPWGAETGINDWEPLSPSVGSISGPTGFVRLRTYKTQNLLSRENVPEFSKTDLQILGNPNYVKGTSQPYLSFLGEHLALQQGTAQLGSLLSPRRRGGRHPGALESLGQELETGVRWPTLAESVWP